jgi:hypothetical protein
VQELSPDFDDTDTFVPEEVSELRPEELEVPPMPRPSSREEQKRKQAKQDESRIRIIAAFRHAKNDRPLTDPIPPAEFDKAKHAADDLIKAGATPETVITATERALNTWTDNNRVTLRAIAGHYTDLTTILPQRVRPAQQRRLTAWEQSQDEKLTSSVRLFGDMDQEIADYEEAMAAPYRRTATAPRGIS